ncbi:hypothetical protein OIO90_006107 [Microbotryomycetes sp. JL221]|nr:hypothetical protein OIO90_006107 [Microbotryomycetes sp. JL221]
MYSSNMASTSSNVTLPPCTCNHHHCSQVTASSTRFQLQRPTGDYTHYTYHPTNNSNLRQHQQQQFEDELEGRLLNRTTTLPPAYNDSIRSTSLINCAPPMWTPPNSANSSLTDLTSSSSSHRHQVRQREPSWACSRNRASCLASSSSSSLAYQHDHQLTSQTNLSTTSSSSTLSIKSRKPKLVLRKIASAFDVKAEQERRLERKQRLDRGGGNRVGNMMWDMSNGW